MSRTPPPSRKRWRSALLSALVFPGMGQLVNRRPWRALAFAAASAALLFAFAQRVYVEASGRMPDDPAAILDPELPFRVAAEVERANASFFRWTTLGLAALWAASIVDAWRGARAAVWHAGVSLPRVEDRRLRERGMTSQRFCSHCGAPLPAPPPVTCAACDTSHWLDAKPCAGALVTRDGRLLLVRRAHEPWRGHWDVPGGFCGPREHPREAAAREVREETGLAVRVGEILGMWMDDYAPSGPDADKVTLNIYFHARIHGPAEPTVDPYEVSEIAWFAPDQLPEPLAFPGHIPAVLRAWRARRERSEGGAARE